MQTKTYVVVSPTHYYNITEHKETKPTTYSIFKNPYAVPTGRKIYGTGIHVGTGTPFVKTTMGIQTKYLLLRDLKEIDMKKDVVSSFSGDTNLELSNINI